MASPATINKQQQVQKEPFTTYKEKKINGTLYRVTCVYKGDIELRKALEDLTVKKILALQNAPRQYAGSKT
jgi:uncharacterized lipoprotein YehR (DUF1307 family)